MLFIPAPRKVNYTQAKANCPVSLLSFMQKMMQTLVTRNIKDETMEHAPTPLTICLKTREVHRNHNALCDYTHTGSSGKHEFTLELL